MEIQISYLAIILSAVASVLVGFVWYGFLFQKKWMALMEFTEDSMKDMKMTPMMATVLQFVVSLFMAYVLSHVMILSQAFYGYSPVTTALSTAFFLWLGFIAPITLGVVLWEGKSWKLWFINASNYLVTVILMALIIAFLA